jgi:hypothetical protein
MLYYNCPKGKKEEIKMVRIGATILDTDSLSAEDIDVIVEDLKRVAARKRRKESLLEKFTDLITTARSEGFDFVEKDFGNVLTSIDWDIYDHRQ